MFDPWTARPGGLGHWRPTAPQRTLSPTVRHCSPPAAPIPGRASAAQRREEAMIEAPIRLSLAAATLAAAAPAQYLNRALWLGSDEESVRRDYRQGPEYFLDRTSYVDLGPWHRSSLDPFGGRLSFAAGSVSSSRLTVEAVGNLAVDLGAGFAARLAYLQSENQTTQYERVGFGLEHAIHDDLTLFLLLEGGPDKSRSDFSFGAQLFRGEAGAHRVTFTAVDAAWRKGDDFVYDQAPYGLMFSGFVGRPGDLELGYEIGLQLPFVERDEASSDTLRMRRAIGSLEARLPIGLRDRLILGLDGERTAKELRTADPTGAAREDLDTGLGRVRLEWWRSFEDGAELALGSSLLRLRNDGVRPNAPAEDLDEDRSEWMLFARGRLALGGAWSMEPYLIGGLVRYEERVGGIAGTSADGFEGKWGLPVAFAFSERAWIRFDLSFQLDELAFGGGGVQFQARF
jgi:hypothetical protein